LHPEWQQLILEMLRVAFPKLQLIVTTHSPHVLTSVYAEQIRVIQVADGDLEVKQPLYQTRGVESADVLAAIMGVDPVPRVKEARWLSDYRAMIEDGTEQEEDGTQLRTCLENQFPLRARRLDIKLVMAM